MPHSNLLCVGAVCYAETPDGTKIAVHQRNKKAVLRVFSSSSDEIPPRYFDELSAAMDEFVRQLQCRI